MTRICRAAYLWASMILLVLGTGSSWNRDLGLWPFLNSIRVGISRVTPPPQFGGWTFKTTHSWH